MIRKINWFQLIVIVVVTELIGMLAALFSGSMGQNYLALTKPPLSPPGWLFGVVWPVLYLLMGIAAYLIYQEPQTPCREKAIVLYWIQLFINFLWPIVFFGFERYWISVIVIIILDALVLITAILFYKIRKPAGYLLLPYLIWLLYATYLNIGIAVLN